MQVPKDFKFPNPRLREGLQFWLKGQSVLQDGASRVQPFCKLVPYSLPKKAQKLFNVKWKPVFLFLEEGAELQLPGNIEGMTADKVNAKYKKCVRYLKKTVSYCWKNKKIDPGIPSFAPNLSKKMLTRISRDKQTSADSNVK